MRNGGKSQNSRAAMSSTFGVDLCSYNFNIVTSSECKVGGFPTHSNTIECKVEKITSRFDPSDDHKRSHNPVSSSNFLVIYCTVPGNPALPNTEPDVMTTPMR